uniref:Putative secreted peptide n=1 Tax=Anopheles braziliensis TaxID=58242 RepID=A0A2M3ZR96_9DIPT
MTTVAVAAAAPAVTCCCCFVERFACTGRGGPGDTSHSIFRRNFQRSGNNGALLSAAAAHLPEVVHSSGVEEWMEIGFQMAGWDTQRMGPAQGALLIFSETVATGSCAGGPARHSVASVGSQSAHGKISKPSGHSFHFRFAVFACCTCTPTDAGYTFTGGALPVRPRSLPHLPNPRLAGFLHVRFSLQNVMAPEFYGFCAMDELGRIG